MKMNTLNNIRNSISLLIVILLMILMYTSGYYEGYDKEQTCIENNFLFECNPYSEPYYSCNKDLMFRNITGLYCGDRLVCKNELKIGVGEKRR